MSSISSILWTTTTIDEDIPYSKYNVIINSNQLVQMAFRDFDNKRFEASNKECTTALNKCRELNRPRDIIFSLLKARYPS